MKDAEELKTNVEQAALTHLFFVSDNDQNTKKTYLVVTVYTKRFIFLKRRENKFYGYFRVNMTRFDVLL